jgi:hypothetical protein
VTVRTIHAIEAAEGQIYQRYQMTTKQVRDVMRLLMDQMNSSCEFHAIGAVDALLTQYLKWKGQEAEEKERLAGVAQVPPSGELFA